ncbi:uncharacterized protein H6S33_003439 [Morchella sextelata]|uniref:uncharacterized protein n=1 Tax=Morchella sextelata TaxID=1174677 RepID=UPI001D04CAFD|nr:uncharacterized protein H6S33_003439 [Morchella sextelata]KAH0606605.1 hypothetical protein H6S33_003439 [Morchella sextelata]
MHKITLLLAALFGFILLLTSGASAKDPCFFAPGYAPPVHEAKTALSNYLRNCNNNNTPRVPIMNGGQETWGCTEDFAVFERAAIRICPFTDAQHKKPRIQWTCDEIRSTGEALIQKCQKDGLVAGKMSFRDPVRGEMKITWNYLKPMPPH